MSKQAMRDCPSIPSDFPRADIVKEVFASYQMCKELVAQIVEEIRKKQLRSPLISTSEIVEMRFEMANKFGWGSYPGEVSWIFRNVVRELGCEMPAFLVQQLL